MLSHVLRPMITAFCTLEVGYFAAIEAGTRVVTRAKYWISDFMRHGRAPFTPIPRAGVAATMRVRGMCGDFFIEDGDVGDIWLL